MPVNFYRNRFTWLAYLILALDGYFLNIIGPIIPFLKDELKLSYTINSLHYTASAIGILLVGLGGHFLINRVGIWQALWIGAIGMRLVLASILLASAGFLIFWKCDLILLSLLGLFVTGLGVVSLYPLIISLVIDAANGYSTQASSRATLASGTGILILPLVLGHLAETIGIR